MLYLELILGSPRRACGSRADLVLETSPFASSSPSTSADAAHHDSATGTADSGYCLPVFGRDGGRPSSSYTRTPWFAGTAWRGGGTGPGRAANAGRAPADRPSLARANTADGVSCFVVACAVGRPSNPVPKWYRFESGRRIGCDSGGDCGHASCITHLANSTVSGIGRDLPADARRLRSTVRPNPRLRDLTANFDREEARLRRASCSVRCGASVLGRQIGFGRCTTRGGWY